MWISWICHIRFSVTVISSPGPGVSQSVGWLFTSNLLSRNCDWMKTKNKFSCCTNLFWKQSKNVTGWYKTTWRGWCFVYSWRWQYLLYKNSEQVCSLDVLTQGMCFEHMLALTLWYAYACPNSLIWVDGLIFSLCVCHTASVSASLVSASCDPWRKESVNFSNRAEQAHHGPWGFALHLGSRWCDSLALKAFVWNNSDGGAYGRWKRLWRVLSNAGGWGWPAVLGDGEWGCVVFCAVCLTVHVHALLSLLSWPWGGRVTDHQLRIHRV